MYRILVVLIGLLAAAPLGAQEHPFAPGERLEYRARWRFVEIGTATSHVSADTLQGRPVWHLSFALEGGPGWARVRDHYESWILSDTIESVQFRQRIRQPRHRRDRTLFFDRSSKTWWSDSDTTRHALASDAPLDDLSFLYYVRANLPEVGRSVELHRYYKDEGNPVRITTEGRDTIATVLGKRTPVLRVRPEIRTKGLFGQGGKAAVYFTDDERRIPVLIRTEIPVIGALVFELSAVTASTNARNAAAARAPE